MPEYDTPDLSDWPEKPKRKRKHKEKPKGPLVSRPMQFVVAALAVLIGLGMLMWISLPGRTDSLDYAATGQALNQTAQALNQTAQALNQTAQALMPPAAGPTLHPQIVTTLQALLTTLSSDDEASIAQETAPLRELLARDRNPSPEMILTVFARIQWPAAAPEGADSSAAMATLVHLATAVAR